MAARSADRGRSLGALAAPATIAAASCAMVAGALDASLWRDEAATATAASRSTTDLVALLQNVDTGLAGYYAAMHGWASIVGTSEVALRLPSLVAAAITVLVAGALGNRLAGPMAGGVAAALVALHPVILPVYAVEARPYAMSTALVTVAAYVAHRHASSGSTRSAVGWALAASGAGLLHPLAALAVAPQVAWIVAGRSGPAWRLPATVAVPFLVSAAVAVAAAQSTQLQSWIAEESWSALPWLARVTVGLGAAGVLLAAAVAGGLRRVLDPSAAASSSHDVATRRDAAVVVAWAGGPLVALALLSWLGTAAMLARYALPSAVGAAVLAGVAVAWAVAGIGRTGAGRGVDALAGATLVLVGVAAVAVSVEQGALRPADEPEDLRAAIRWITSRHEPDDGILYAPTWAEAGLRWYLVETRDGPAPEDVSADPSTGPVEAGNIWHPPTDVRATTAGVAERDRIWIAGYPGGEGWDPVPDVGTPVADVVRRCWDRRERRWFGDLAVELHVRPSGRPPAQDCP